METYGDTLSPIFVPAILWDLHNAFLCGHLVPGTVGEFSHLRPSFNAFLFFRS